MMQVSAKLLLCVLLSSFSTALAARRVVAKLTSNDEYVVNDAVVFGDRTLVLGYMQGDATEGKEMFVGSVSRSGHLDHSKYIGGSTKDDELYHGVISSGYLYAVGSSAGSILTDEQEVNREGNRTVVLQIPLTSLNPIATYAGPIADERMHTIAHTSRGTFIAGSRFGSHAGMIIKKLTRRLEYDWEIVVGSPEGSAKRIAADDDGDIFLAGTDVTGTGEGEYLNFRKFFDATHGAVVDLKLTARRTNLRVDGLALDFNGFPLLIVSDQFSSEMIKLNRNGLILWRHRGDDPTCDLVFDQKGYFTLRPEGARSRIMAFTPNGVGEELDLDTVPAADALAMDTERKIILTFRRGSSTLTGVELAWNTLPRDDTWPFELGRTHKAVLCDLMVDQLDQLSSVAVSYIGDVIAELVGVRRKHVFLHSGRDNLLQVRIAVATQPEAHSAVSTLQLDLQNSFEYHDVGPIAMKGDPQIVRGDRSDSHWQETSLHSREAAVVLASRVLIGLMSLAILVLVTLIVRRMLNRRNKNRNVHAWLEQTRNLRPSRDDRQELASDLSSVHSDDIEASAVE